MKTPIPHDQWRWFGLPGHFICADRCRFHLCTVVGDFMVSSVGAFFANDDDAKPSQVGCDRLYETYVFKVTGGVCECGCGLPNREGSEIDSLPANDAATANANHMTMCEKYAALTIDEVRE